MICMVRVVRVMCDGAYGAYAHHGVCDGAHGVRGACSGVNNWYGAWFQCRCIWCE